MEYKTKGKEGTNATGQRKESKLGKVNKKGPGVEKKDKADDISNNFPNFSVLNQEERLAFFEALSAARKNIEKRGLPTRERFGTVHDEYLQYFAQDDKGETVRKKPETAPSVKPSRGPVAGRTSPKEYKLTTPESPKQRVLRRPQPVSPTLKKTVEPPRKTPLRPESEPNDFCESVIKRDTDKMIQIYLDKKRKIEEQWKKSSPKTAVVPASPKNRKRDRPAGARAASRDEDSRGKTPAEAVTALHAPQFQALNLTERKEFFRILKEAHTNVLFKNPQKTDQILTLEEVLEPYNGGGAAMTDCGVAEESHKRRQQQKNLRVKVTLTSGDNKRLASAKSQTANEIPKESCERSKSLESILCPDTARGKQSKIPILKKAPHEKNEFNEGYKEKPLLKEDSCYDSIDKIGPTKEPGAEIKDKTLTIKEGKKEEGRENGNQASKKCEEGNRFDSHKLKQRARELNKRKETKKAQKEKAQKEKEAAKKEKELLKNKKKEDRKRKFWKKDKKDECKSKSSFEVNLKGKKVEKVKKKNERKQKKNQEKKGECEKNVPCECKANHEMEDECEKNVPCECKANHEMKVECENLKEHEKKEEFEEKTCEMPCQERHGVSEKEEDEEECQVTKKLREETMVDEECPHHKQLAECQAESEEQCPHHHKQLTECQAESEEQCPHHHKQLTECQAESAAECPHHQHLEECQAESAAECPHHQQLAECQAESEGECPHHQHLEECQAESEGECPHHQHLAECQAESEEECPHQHATASSSSSSSSESSTASAFEDVSWPEHQRKVSCHVGSAQVVKGTKSPAGVSLVEERPEEIHQTQEMAPVYTSGKVVVVDDSVIKRIKDLIQYLDNKVNPKDNLESEYVKLILGYTEYLTKVTESLVNKKLKKGPQVHRTYAAPEVHLKFEDKDNETRKEGRKKARIPRSFSENELQPEPIPGPSGIEKTEVSRRKPSNYDFLLSDSESSSNSEDEYRSLTPSAFKKTGIPTTKIRLLQDLLKGRAKFEEGSVNDFKIVHCPEAEYVPPEKPPTGGPKEIIEGDVDQGQKAMGMKFLRHLAKLCNCGRKQIEEEAILENLKGEAVRVDTAEAKKDPASATINESTMEVLKAAERKKIIEKYLMKDQS